MCQYVTDPNIYLSEVYIPLQLGELIGERAASELNVHIVHEHAQFPKFDAANIQVQEVYYLKACLLFLYHISIIILVSVIAENIDDRIPMVSATAKLFIIPEPNT